MRAMFKTGCRYWHTLRYLKMTQIVGRVQQRFKRAKLDLSACPEINVLTQHWLQPARQPVRMLGQNTVCFLNETHDITCASDWNHPQWAKLWLYNLHYFDDLSALHAEQRVAWHRAWVQRWVDENAPGRGNGWEPYPSSLRIVNWVKWALAGNALEPAWMHSLAVQTRYLAANLETHLLGNHLFANAKALMFAGVFFKGAEADGWYQVGLNLVNRELREQVLPDGGNFELSTLYHCIFLQDLLDLVNLQRAGGRALADTIEARIAAMLRWLQTMCHPDGAIAFFNDAAFGVAASVPEIFEYGARLSLFADPPAQASPHLTVLPDSGYARVVIGEAVALIDRAAIGPDYLPGHAHADTLSFELSLFGQRVMVNSGTSVYGVGAERLRQRGTAAHTTVVVDGADSSEVWSGFRVARRASIFALESHHANNSIRLSACHDGYQRLAGKPTHGRQWQFTDHALVIDDHISGQGQHQIEVVLPLHPAVQVASVDQNKVALAVSGRQVEVVFDGEGVLHTHKSTYHPEFGLSVENTQLIYRVSGRLPIHVITRMAW